MSRTIRFVSLGFLAVFVVYFVLALSVPRVAPPTVDASTLQIVAVKRGSISLTDPKLRNVLYVERPVQAAPNTNVRIFRVVGGGSNLERVTVKFGPVSENYIEVLRGLKEGDRIVQSDMSVWATSTVSA